MGRTKFGVDAKKAATTEAKRFEVYDGPTPPRAPYQVKVTRMFVKQNSNGDPMITTFVVVDEPVKKDGHTNPKARYNGAFAVDRQNVTEQSAGFVNSFIESLGGTQADKNAFWGPGIVTKGDEKDATVEQVLSIGKVKPIGVHAIALLGMGQASTKNGKTYEAKLEVQSWLVSSQIKGSQDEDDFDVEDDDEEVSEEEVEEAEAEDEELDAEDDDEVAARQVALEGLSRVALKKALKESGSDLKVVRTTTDEDMVNAILDIEFPEDEESEEEDEEEEIEEDEEEEGDDLDEKTRLELKGILRDEKIDLKVLKSTSDDAIRAAIRAARGGEEDDEEEEEEEKSAKPAARVGRRSKNAGEPPF